MGTLPACRRLRTPWECSFVGRFRRSYISEDANNGRMGMVGLSWWSRALSSHSVLFSLSEISNNNLTLEKKRALSCTVIPGSYTAPCRHKPWSQESPLLSPGGCLYWHTRSILSAHSRFIQHEFPLLVDFHRTLLTHHALALSATRKQEEKSYA